MASPGVVWFRVLECCLTQREEPPYNRPLVIRSRPNRGESLPTAAGSTFGTLLAELAMDGAIVCGVIL